MESINTINNQIDDFIDFANNVKYMREMQKRYSVYTTDISANELTAMVKSIEQVDDFLAKRRAADVHPEISYKCAECGNEVITIVERLPLGDDKPFHEKHCDNCGCRDFISTTGGDMIMEGE